MMRDCHRDGSIRLMNRLDGASATIYGIYTGVSHSTLEDDDLEGRNIRSRLLL
jgi:hypothetical protein